MLIAISGLFGTMDSKYKNAFFFSAIRSVSIFSLMVKKLLMSKTDLYVRPAFIATNEKLPDRSLFVGKVERPNLVGGFYFYLIEILSPLTPASKIKKIITHILEKSDPPDDPNLREVVFEDTVAKINESLEDLAKEGERDWVGNFNAVLGIVCKGHITISQSGGASGYIFRKGTISSITEKSSPETPSSAVNVFSEITSGTLINNDRLIFGSTELYNHLSLDRLRRLSEKVPAPLAATEIAKYLKRSKVLMANAVIIEVCDREAIENETLEAQQEVIYLDEPGIDLISVVKKNLYPLSQKVLSHSRAAGSVLAKKSNVVLKKSKENWRSNYAPLTQKILDHGKSQLGNTLNNLSKSAKPALGGTLQKIKQDKVYKKATIKIIPYTQRTKDRANGTTKIIISLTQRLLLRENRKYLYLALILSFLFFGYVKIRANNQDLVKVNEEKSIVSSFDEAQSTFAKAKEDVALGRGDGVDKYQQALSLAQNALKSDVSKNESDNLIKEIQNSIDVATKTTRLANTSALFKLAPDIQQIALVGTEIYGADSEGKIFVADTRDKDVRLIASIGRDNGSVIDATYVESSNKIVFYTDQKKVLALNPTTKTVENIAIVENPNEWEDTISISSYVSNIYLLDSSKGTVWKHLARDGGYSKGSNYADSKKVSLADAIDIAVDGDIFALKKDSTLVKFIKGSYDPTFSLKNIPKPHQKIEEPAELHTDADSSSIFILDKKLNRILRFDKSGEFTNQYILDGIATEHFVVNPRLQKIWSLSDGQIFEINL